MENIFFVKPAVLLLLFCSTTWSLGLTSVAADSTPTGKTLNSATTLGHLYRQSRDAYRNDNKQSRCISCLYQSQYPNSRERDYYDNYYYQQQQQQPQGYYPAAGRNNNNNYNYNYNEDRNWYLQPDRYDDRSRYGGSYSSYYGNRYDDRYYNNNRYDDRYENSRPTGYYNNRYDTRNQYSYNNDNRGNGYDNRDNTNNYYNDGLRGDGYYNNRGGGGGGAGGYSDRYYDRGYGGGVGGDSRYQYDRDSMSDRYYPNSYRASGGGGGGGVGGGYENRYYRPVDETYRGSSGFDDSGRGYYFANKPAQSIRPLTSQSQEPEQLPPRPMRPPSYRQHQTPSMMAPVLPLPPKRNNHHTYESSSSSTMTMSGDGGGGPHNNNNNNNGQYDDRGGDGNRNVDNNRLDNRGNININTGNKLGGTWGYVNDDKTRNNNYAPNFNRENDMQSSTYGSYARPLGTSYLHDRDTSTTVVTEKNMENTKTTNSESIIDSTKPKESTEQQRNTN